MIKDLGGRPFDFMDYLSTHVYPEKTDPLNPLKDAAQKAFLNQIITPLKIEVWNTETGTWSQGIYQGVDSGFRAAGEPISPAKEAWRYYRGHDYEAAMVRAISSIRSATASHATSITIRAFTLAPIA